MAEKSIYSLLKENRNKSRKRINIIESDDYNRKLLLKQKIVKYANLSEEKKKFLLDQFIENDNNLHLIEKYSFKAGSYSVDDLISLIELYEEYLINITNPFNNIFPIIIDKKTYLNNLALYIAALELNLNPALISLDEICLDRIENSSNSDKKIFYVASSGSTSLPKLCELNEQMLLDKLQTNYLSFFDKEGRYYLDSPICNISGLQPFITLLLGTDIDFYINSNENYFSDLEKYNINYAWLPINYVELYKKNNKETFTYPNLTFFVSGGFFTKRNLVFMEHDILNKNALSNVKYFYLYGRTENCGYCSGHQFDFSNDEVNRICNINVPKILNLKFNKHYFLMYLLKDKGILNTISNYDSLVCTEIESFSTPYISIGKINSNMALDSYPIGELIIDNQRTGDIALLDEEGFLYILYRKGNVYEIFCNLLKSKVYSETYIVEKNKKKYLVLNDPYTIDYSLYLRCVKLYQHYIHMYSFENEFYKYPIIKSFSSTDGVGKYLHNDSEINEYLIAKKMDNYDYIILSYICNKSGKDLKYFVQNMIKLSNENLLNFINGNLYECNFDKIDSMEDELCEIFGLFNFEKDILSEFKFLDINEYEKKLWYNKKLRKILVKVVEEFYVYTMQKKSNSLNKDSVFGEKSVERKKYIEVQKKKVK